MAYGRIVYRRDPNANSNSYADDNSNAYARPHSRADADTKSESGVVQWNSGLECECDIYGRSAGARERLHLRSQVVESKPEPGDQLRRRWSMAAYRPLRPAGSEPESGQRPCGGGESNAVQPDVPQSQPLLYLSGITKRRRHLPRIRGNG